MAQVNANAGLPAENRPLSGRRIVITRARSQAGAFAEALENLGAEVIEFPTIEILPPESYDALDRALQRIEKYDWIIFTSVNGAKFFGARLAHLNREIRALKGIQVVAIGPETARAVRSLGLTPHIVPEEYRAEGILDGLRPEEMRGKRVLLPRAAEAREILARTLREWGAEVDVVQAYRTVAANGDAGRLESMLREKKIDMITFTSSSTVSHFAALFPGAEMRGLPADTAVACIGPITRGTAEEMGIRVDVVSKEYTITGLTRAIVEYFGRQRQR